jgi:hypothetical protein
MDPVSAGRGAAETRCEGREHGSTLDKDTLSIEECDEHAKELLDRPGIEKPHIMAFCAATGDSRWRADAVQDARTRCRNESLG